MTPVNADALYLLAPELSLTLLALVVMTVDLFVKRKAVVAGVALLGLIVPAGFVIAQALTIQAPQRAFFNMLVVDQYALFFDVIFLLIAAVMILASYNYVEQYVKADGEFYTLMLFSVVGMMLMASTGELITIYIALELTSIPLYVMAGLIRTSERSAEAAVKYVLLGAMSSAILLYGFALLYGLTGTTDLIGIAHALGGALNAGNLLVLIAIVLIIAGFGFKISAVPFHMWSPDIYEGAPTPATAFFSVGSKAAGFAALMRVLIYGGLGQNHTVNLTTVVVLGIVAALTMTLGNLVAAVQSSVAASFASGKPDGNAAVLFFLLVYVITNLGAFSGIIALANLTGGERVDDFRGLWRRAPLLSTGTALCLLSLAGIPPVAGFWSKLFLFSTAWNLGQSWLVVIALLNSIVSLVYYGRIVKTMFFDEPLKKDRLVTKFGLATSLTLSVAALLILTVVAQVVLDAATPA
ncbi:MAG: NADH-quinone oxidoreductase subunit N, partial [Chloroflexi bacterium]